MTDRTAVWRLTQSALQPAYSHLTEKRKTVATSKVGSMCKDPGKRESQVPLENCHHLAPMEAGVYLLWGSSEQLVRGDY